MSQSTIDPPGAPGIGASGAPVPAATDRDAVPAGSGPRPRRAHRRRVAAEWVGVLCVAALVALGLRSFVLQAFYVPSSSMYPTLQTGDRIVVDKFLFSPASLRDGDIIVFARPPGDTAGVCDDPTATDLVKRVVASPGQTIRSRGDEIIVDGRVQPEPYLVSGTRLGRAVPFERVPPGHYYVMGDNRYNSCDSRYWGTVRASTIVGRVMAVIWRHGHPMLDGL